MGVTFGNNLYSKTQNENQQNQNYNQKPPPNNQQQQNYSQNQTRTQNSFDRYEFQPLYKLGLDVVEQNGYLVVIGENQYACKDSIKALSFKFDSKSKCWYRQINEQKAA